MHYKIDTIEFVMYSLSICRDTPKNFFILRYLDENFAWSLVQTNWNWYTSLLCIGRCLQYNVVCKVHILYRPYTEKPNIIQLLNYELFYVLKVFRPDNLFLLISKIFSYFITLFKAFFHHILILQYK